MHVCMILLVMNEGLEITFKPPETAKLFKKYMKIRTLVELHFEHGCHICTM